MLQQRRQYKSLLLICLAVVLCSTRCANKEQLNGFESFTRYRCCRWSNRTRLWQLTARWAGPPRWRRLNEATTRSSFPSRTWVRMTWVGRCNGRRARRTCRKPAAKSYSFVLKILECRILVFNSLTALLTAQIMKTLRFYRTNQIKLST